MTRQFKPGDRAEVVVDYVSESGNVYLQRSNGCRSPADWVKPEVLHPLPTPDPLTELERAVVEHALITADGATRGNLAYLCAKVRAARQPVDPVKELQEAWRMITAAQPISADLAQRLERAIAALEALAKKERGL